MLAAVPLSTHIIGTTAVITLTGRLTVTENRGVIRDAVATLVKNGTRAVILDLSGVPYLDSTRLGELIAAHVTLSRTGSHLRLAATPTRVVELLTLAGLGEIFERFDTVEAAISSAEAAQS